MVRRGPSGIFDQGLRLYLGFWHREAIRPLREGKRLDSTSAIRTFGVVLASEPTLMAA
jgi:hypothetical protein